jgi:uncharacterized protein
MPQIPASRQKFFRTAESLLIGTVGGLLFSAAKFPAGWLAGSMIFAAVAALAGRTIHVPRLFARACSVVLGITIGGVVTPETLRGMATWPLSIAMVAISVAAATLATSAYLTRVHRWNAITATLASIPGGLAQVMALATEARRNCDIRAVAIVQTLRVVILTVVVPAALSLAGHVGAVRLPANQTAVAEAPVAFAILIGASSAVGLGLLRLGFPGGVMFGPLVVSAVLHGGALIDVTMPSWLAIAAMVGLGTLSGGRFSGMPFRLMLGYLGAALGAFVISLVVTAAIGIVVTLATPLPIAEVIVAYAPGAVDAMMILALALNLDPVFVGAHHLTRVFVVSLGLPILAHYFSASGSKRPKTRWDKSPSTLPKGDGLDD